MTIDKAGAVPSAYLKASSVYSTVGVSHHHEPGVIVMRKLLVSSFVSLDGVVESPMTWASRFFDDECTEYALRKLDDVEFSFSAASPTKPLLPPGLPSRETHT